MKFSTRINLIGKVFGYLTVVKYSYTQNKKAYWECLCSCETVKIIRGSHLTSGKINSCGCKTSDLLSSKNRKFEPRIASARKIYKTNYADGDLSFENFMILTQLPCHYCGDFPSNVHNRFIGKTTVKDSLENGTFIYNGLDRTDSFRPHDTNNVVPCCSICNYAKLQMTTEEFKNWLFKIVSHYLFKGV